MTAFSDEIIHATLVDASGDAPHPLGAAASVSPASARGDDEKLASLLSRIKSLAASAGAARAGAEAADENQRGRDVFTPTEPDSFVKADLTDSEVEGIVLKYLLACTDATGRTIADQVKLPFVLMDECLRRLKNEQLLCHRGSAAMNDFVYQLTDLGRERARRFSEHCTYFGSAPVSLGDYVEGVKRQSLTIQHPTREDLHRAFQDLLLNKKMLDRLGPAINSGRGLFLFGAPGNGKTSIAERVTAAFGEIIWIPRAIGIGGEILRLFDPIIHEEVPLPTEDGLMGTRKIDKRWVRIKRPTIVAGGELTMSQLEVTVNTTTGISEAPLQMKSNCGTLVIDDFGRQRMRIDELLNRWIVPLEKRYDFLNLRNGKKIQVPFDQLVVFSTNLEPRELVDEAFLRRVPYKVEVIDPTEEEFRQLFELMAKSLGIEYHREVVEYLIEVHYKAVQRPLRFCQPRDLLLQVRNDCRYNGTPLVMTSENLDRAVENYFAVM